MKIIKSTGERVEYDPTKIRKTLLRTGADAKLVDRVIKRVSKRVTRDMATKRLFAIVRRELRRESRHLAQRYNLRNALIKLGPAGFKFEKYVSSILNAYEYKAHVPQKDLVGLCVNHEIDVIAEKDGRRMMIEAKFRNRFGDKVKLKDTMATWARFVDLCDGSRKNKSCPHLDEVWIVTNGAFSDRSLQFGLCKGIDLVGWSTKQHSLATLVDHASLYPITVLDGLQQWELDKFSDIGLMLCREVATKSPGRLSGRTGMPRQRIANIIEQCKEVAGMG
ncbi:MAG: hypothetical protein U9Q03_02890 [Patescibacteria group bacterium]|nr:hypothetical protein [Patescibacteria group bacterium]